jgi:DNA sulfur modification protein DndE
MDAATFFATMAELMKDNPPDPADTPMLATLATIGIQPGQEFDINRLDPAVARGIQRAPQAAQAAIDAHARYAGMTANGWMIPLRTGNYGTDYLQRAYIAAYGLGANRPQDAVYPVARVDARGRPLSGANRYVIRFARNQLPPVNGFWSLTMYDSELFFVENPLKRYALGSRAPFTYNPDGSLDLYIQHEPPEQDKQSNWLPAPAGGFVLMLRLYWPKDSVLQGAWIPPAVQPR